MAGSIIRPCNYTEDTLVQQTTLLFTATVHRKAVEELDLVHRAPEVSSQGNTAPGKRRESVGKVSGKRRRKRRRKQRRELYLFSKKMRQLLSNCLLSIVMSRPVRSSATLRNCKKVIKLSELVRIKAATGRWLNDTCLLH